MSGAADPGLTHLPPASAGLAAVFARPKVLAAVCVIALAGLGWFYLGLLTADMGTLAALCGPHPAAGLAGAVLIASMWCAMVLAMMLPSAAPMIFTYAEIADTAARKGERIVSPFVLAAGYTAVWLGFAATATLAQFAFSHLGPVGEASLLSGAIFIGAGAYQFSTLKHACLTQCRRPFPFFFAHWQTTPRGVFRLGLKQGLYCLGCCWAMMLVMFAAGVMNVFWMASLAIIMTIEKFGTGRRFSQAIGVALIAVGFAFVMSAFAGHWPLHAI
jgi:predicted metal-binding membrane protein